MNENPTHLQIENEIYEINTDFRTWIDFERLSGDRRVTDDAKLERMIALVFPEPPQNADLRAVMRAMFYFYGCGDNSKHRDEEEEEKDDAGQPIRRDIAYDYNVDLWRIKAEYTKQFGYNPWELPYMHWFDYKASFENLLGFSFSEIAKIRTMDLRELKGKMQIRYGRLKNRLKIRTIDDDIAEAENQAAVAAFETGGLAAYLRELNAGKGDK